MKKDTIIIHTIEKMIFGYSLMPHSQPNILTNNGILNRLCEWSKNKNVTIYSHEVRYEDVNLKKYKDKHQLPHYPYEVPYCDRIYYLDIYYQEK